MTLAEQGARAQTRLLLVDFARVLAILFMIQGHTLDVLLAPVYRQGTAYDSWLFLRGLTAPMFLTLSGVSFTLASVRHWDSYLRMSPQLSRRLRRFGFFILLGYAMHLPVKSFTDFRFLGAAGWRSGLQVDVLQCIGLTLILLQLLVFVGKTPQVFAKLSLGIGAFIVLFSPVSWALNWTRVLPLPLASYFYARTGSIFPLLPWASYVLVGAALGYLFAQRQSGRKPFPIRPLAAGGALLILLGTVLHQLPFSPYGVDVNFWKTSPNLFLIRVGSVCTLLAVLAYATRRIRIPEQATRSLAQESLTIYFIHVCLLYGSIWTVGLRQMIGATLTPLPTLGWICVFVASMTALGWTWNWTKRAKPGGSLLIRSTAVALVLAYGLT